MTRVTDVLNECNLATYAIQVGYAGGEWNQLDRHKGNPVRPGTLDECIELVNELCRNTTMLVAYRVVDKHGELAWPIVVDGEVVDPRVDPKG